MDASISTAVTIDNSELEDDGYIALRRAFADRKLVTWYRLTGNGRKALDKHLRTLQDTISTAAP